MLYCWWDYVDDVKWAVKSVQPGAPEYELPAIFTRTVRSYVVNSTMSVTVMISEWTWYRSGKSQIIIYYMGTFWNIDKVMDTISEYVLIYRFWRRPITQYEHVGPVQCVAACVSAERFIQWCHNIAIYLHRNYIHFIRNLKIKFRPVFVVSVFTVVCISMYSYRLWGRIWMNDESLCGNVFVEVRWKYIFFPLKPIILNKELIEVQMLVFVYIKPV